MRSRQNRLVISGGQVLAASGTSPGTILIDGTRITSFRPRAERADASLDDGAAGTVRPAAVDADGLVGAPGLIDLQINGGFGIDLATAPETVWDLGRRLPATGVTSFCPTIISSPPAMVDRLLAALDHRPAEYEGAEPVGAHLEGPMLNPDRRGAHQSHHLLAPDPLVYQRWSRDAGVAIVTLAPELPGATAAITALSEAGVVVSGGHSTATAGHAAAAADAGMSMVTHLFNAMAPIGHRAPNLAGFALADRRITTGVIVDGVHVDPLMVHVAWRSAGPRRFVLVSDAVAAMGLGAGEHQLGGRTVTADHNSVRTPDGTLAGTNLTMDAAVRNLMAFTDADLPAALQAASATPAALLGLNDRGNIASGERADLVLLDNQHRVAMTVCAGQTVYVAPDHRWRLAPTS